MNNTPLKEAFFAYLVIVVLWTLVWIGKVFFVDTTIVWFATDFGSFAWWFVAKIIIWIIPACWLIRQTGRTLAEVFNFTNWKPALLWGGGIGLIAALASLIPAYFSGPLILPHTLSFAFVNAVLFAPLFEEFLTRGSLLGHLQKGHPFWIANVISSLMFVGLHIPGWYFMGTLTQAIAAPIGGALSIFFLGLAFGYAAYKSRSIISSIFAHFLNNLAAQL